MNPDSTPVDRAAHWESVYRTRDESQLSWHQDEPGISHALLGEFCAKDARVIDVGGGTSLFAQRAAAAGYRDVMVMDIAASAIERARLRTGDLESAVRWVVADVTGAGELGTFDFWHDRAVFHFMMAEADRRAYIATVRRSVSAGGHIVIAGFAPDGPEQCSGLPVRRLDEHELAAAFSPDFAVVRSVRERHLTPWGKPQSFVYVVLRRVGPITGEIR